MMNHFFKYTLTLSIILGLNTPLFADNHDAYFKALEKIKKPEANEQAIPPLSESEKKELMVMLKNSKDKELNTYTLDHGQISNEYGESIEAYKGDFSNEHVTQYALVSTSGTMRANRVTILEKQAGQLTNKNLDLEITDNLIPGKEIADFYLYVASPFAVIKEGKTYIRYMSLPYKEYDASQIQLCTYLWETDTITLTGPNWTFDKKTGKMVAFKDCISS